MEGNCKTNRTCTCTCVCVLVFEYYICDLELLIVVIWIKILDFTMIQIRCVFTDACYDMQDVIINANTLVRDIHVLYRGSY